MSGFLMAIDPGYEMSAFVTIEGGTLRPLMSGKIANDDMRRLVAEEHEAGTPIYIERISSYGMRVGVEVFQTCEWIGQFHECSGLTSQRVERVAVKLHHCGKRAAKDADIIQALRDRFAPGVPNGGKGRKAAPGFFYGFRADLWQAFALGVYAADVLEPFIELARTSRIEAQRRHLVDQ